MSKEDVLDEKGFIFLDQLNRPYRCCMYQGEPWLFYWHPDKKWVTCRTVTQTDIFLMPHNLTEKEQECYMLQSQGE